MAAVVSNPGTLTFSEPREHGGYRLDVGRIAAIEDVAKGVEEGESGLKSLHAASNSFVLAVEAGASSQEGRGRAHSTANLIDDEDECFDQIGEMLAKGFSHSEVAAKIQLDGGATKLLALERWCDRVGLTCFADFTPARWKCNALNDKRRRARRTFSKLMRTPAGYRHAAVLHIYYGWPDPFINTIAPDARSRLADYAPLARYTDAVEEKRQELVRVEALRRTAQVAVTTKAVPWHWGGHSRPQDDEINRHGSFEDRRVQHGSEKARAAISMGLRAEEANAGVVDLHRHRERLAYADRLISSGDALRAATQPPRARYDSEAKDHYRDHVKKPADEARAVFLTRVRVDANRMLSEASTAFDAAWDRS